MAYYFDGLPATYIEKIIALQAQAARNIDAWDKIRDYRNYYAGIQPTLLSERQEEYLGDILTGVEHPVVFNLCNLMI